MAIHKPVLLKESIELLNLKPGMTVVDATLGGGGHSLEILKRIMPGGKLIAIDWDEEAVRKFQIKLKRLKLSLKKENIILANDNFARLKNILERLKIKEVNAIIADLGISSDQLESAGRGFSFMKDGPLDMRLSLRNTNPYEYTNNLNARDIINNYSEKELVRILKEFGEEKYAAKIAREIGKRRKIRRIGTTKELVEIISQAVPEKYKHQKLHFAAKTFQALRIETNNELENLKRFLFEAVEVFKKNGRLAVISFHSGEDRIVKNFFRENARGRVLTPKEEIIYGRRGAPALKIITRKLIIPSALEIKENPRARSAKLRIAKKL